MPRKGKKSLTGKAEKERRQKNWREKRNVVNKEVAVPQNQELNAAANPVARNSGDGSEPGMVPTDVVIGDIYAEPQPGPSGLQRTADVTSEPVAGHSGVVPGKPDKRKKKSDPKQHVDKRRNPRRGVCDSRAEPAEIDNTTAIEPTSTGGARKKYVRRKTWEDDRPVNPRYSTRNRDSSTDAQAGPSRTVEGSCDTEARTEIVTTGERPGTAEEGLIEISAVEEAPVAPEDQLVTLSQLSDHGPANASSVQDGEVFEVENLLAGLQIDWSEDVFATEDPARPAGVAIDADPLAAANVIRLPPGEVPAALRPIRAEAEVAPHQCGQLDWECLNCGALYFRRELPVRSRRDDLRGVQRCCAGGKFRLPPVRPVPDLIRDLLNGDHRESVNFMRDIRSYNSSLGFVSVGANIEQLGGRQYGSVFRIHGQISHRISDLRPPANANPSFGQLYIIESGMATDIRLQSHVGLHADLLRDLDRLLREINPYCQAYRMLHEMESAEEASAIGEGREPLRVYMVLSEDVRDDRRRYNLPAGNEVAAVYVTRDGMPPGDRSLAVYPRAAARNPVLREMPSTDRNVDPMSYPLMFPHGDRGWHVDLPYDNPTGARNRVSMMEFYAYRLSIRASFSAILSSGKLTQQFVADAWVKVEGQRLFWIRSNQNELRAELYRGLMDHINNRADAEGVPVGRMVIVPSTFAGSARNMQMLYQDAMAMVRVLGRPDLFVTFTTNPSWPEIEGLLGGRMACDRPDIIARVFNVKFLEFLDDVVKNNIFGHVKAFIYTIEFQKRGYPHAHCLFVLENEFKPRTVDTVDQIVSAEIPDRDSYPLLFSIVEKMYMHGPCGEFNPLSPCMVDGRCSKRFPKDFADRTFNDRNGYPKYRRRDNDRSVVKQGVSLDNRWVVPFNAFVALKYNAHVNVEICTGIQAVKYIYKYVYKGVDSARIAVVGGNGDAQEQLDWDEVRAYLDARYVSAVEAVWRLREFKLHDRSHTVYRLPVHLDGQQNVVFREGQEAGALDRGRNTELTDWFRLNAEDAGARQLLYQDVPQTYCWNGGQRRWSARRRDGGNLISRMHHVSPCDVERFHLRVLLQHVKGPTSYRDVRTHEGVVYDTFVEAARARNLVRSDEEWIRTLDEAVAYQMPRQLRFLFALMCVYCELPDPLSLWLRFRDDLSEDYRRNCRAVELARALAMRDIRRTLRANGRNAADFNLPADEEDLGADLDAGLDAGFDREEERRTAEENVGRLNPEQLGVFERVKASMYDRRPGAANCFLLEGAAGTGKSFLYNVLLAYVRGRGDVAVASAYTGIAATILKGGTTINSAFGLPLSVNEASTSSLAAQSERAELLRSAKLIILDEVTMMSKHHIRIIDDLLKMLTGATGRPFGGKCIVFGGDFRQTLPVMPRADRATVTSSTIKSSAVYLSLERLRLTANMRAAADEVEYAAFLLAVGDGTLRSNVESERGDVLIEVPPACVCPDLIASVFGDRITAEDAERYVHAAILCPRNVDTAEINEQVMDKLETEERTYYSVDSCSHADGQGEEDPLNVPVEFLNTLNPAGFPPHCLKLKVGCVVMLLRNLNVTRGLVNGTRLKVCRLSLNHVEARVLTGSAVGEIVFLCRFELTEANPVLPFSLKRRQLPLKVSYAMTINKAQGQTLTKVGIYLPNPVFSHGQLYVALSRARSLANVSVKVEDTDRQGKLVPDDPRVLTPNVVWREILD